MTTKWIDVDEWNDAEEEIDAREVGEFDSKEMEMSFLLALAQLCHGNIMKVTDAPSEAYVGVSRLSERSNQRDGDPIMKGKNDPKGAIRRASITICEAPCH